MGEWSNNFPNGYGQLIWLEEKAEGRLLRNRYYLEFFAIKDIKVNGLMARGKATESSITQMVPSMRASGKTISNMEKLSLTMKLEKLLNYFSKTTNYCQKSKFNLQTKKKFIHK